jgi:XTP/dITP diphosphohydrolase
LTPWPRPVVPEPLKLYCATSNPGKAREFALAASKTKWSRPVEIEPIPNFRDLPACVEDGENFGQNAMKKAQHYGAHVNGLLFADDSGLVVDALNGAPGIYSARYSGPDATDESNNRLLLENMQGVEDRSAQFVCLLALVNGGRPVGVYAGRVYGSILEAPRGVDGFGYDPLFHYAPFDQTFGEIDAERKFGVSHRGQALRAMLRSLLGPPVRKRWPPPPPGWIEV